MNAKIFSRCTGALRRGSNCYNSLLLLACKVWCHFLIMGCTFVCLSPFVNSQGSKTSPIGGVKYINKNDYRLLQVFQKSCGNFSLNMIHSLEIVSCHKTFFKHQNIFKQETTNDRKPSYLVVNDPIPPRRDLDPTNPSYYDNTADKNGDYNNKVYYTISKFVLHQTIKI